MAMGGILDDESMVYEPYTAGSADSLAGSDEGEDKVHISRREATPVRLYEDLFTKRPTRLQPAEVEHGPRDGVSTGGERLVKEAFMRGSRYLALAAAIAVALSVQGCKRDYKAPEPKTRTSQNVASPTVLVSSPTINGRSRATL